MGIFDNNPNQEQISKMRELMNVLPIVFQVSKRFYLTLAIGMIFTFGGLYMGAKGQNEGYFIAVLFGIVTAFSIYMLSPSGPVLTIDADGFEYKQIMKAERISWKDIKNFSIWQSKSNKMLTWNWNDQLIESGARKKGFGSGLMGFQASFQNHYAIGQKDLLALMNLMLDKYGN